MAVDTPNKKPDSVEAPAVPIKVQTHRWGNARWRADGLLRMIMAQRGGAGAGFQVSRARMIPLEVGINNRLARRLTAEMNSGLWRCKKRLPRAMKW